MNVGEYIKKLRLENGLSQEELGKIVGVQRAAVQKWECGKVQNLKRETIKKLSELFAVSPSSFIEANDDKKVIFTGRIDDMELKALILASDIFCFPSITKNEAFGLALAEGMYYGRPAVTFTIPGSGVNYVSINGETGIEVENRNVEAYANALSTLAGKKELRDRYGKAGKKRVEENFLSTQFCINVKNIISAI